VWVSEVMLQQTQVKTVIPYFERFITQFPTVIALAQAEEDEVLALWSGLGYYSRARYLHHSARLITEHFNGVVPHDLNTLITLPGIGASTAAAICSLAYQQPTAILDGNVKRILARYFLIPGHSTLAATNKQLWTYAQQCMSQTHCADYTQAIMDLGATLCTPKQPQCHCCPLQSGCQAHQQQRVDAYPEKKIKKKLPEYPQQFFLLYNQHQFYLEKRPSSGIWGGLWCLPTRSIRHTHCWDIMQFTHTFSHFKWHIQATALEISQEDMSEYQPETEGMWVTAQQLPTLGLAKPIQYIIEQFLTHHVLVPQSHPADLPLLHV
jgi:A/G-specific adenine glycosylase